MSAHQRGHSEKGLWSRIASAFNCEPPDLYFDMHVPSLMDVRKQTVAHSYRHRGGHAKLCVSGLCLPEKGLFTEIKQHLMGVLRMQLGR